MFLRLVGPEGAESGDKYRLISARCCCESQPRLEALSTELHRSHSEHRLDATAGDVVDLGVQSLEQAGAGRNLFLLVVAL